MNPVKPGLPRLLYQSIKAAFRMRFGGYDPGSSGGQWSFSWGQFTGTRVNFAAEAGKLINSSLVMSAVNWLGRVLPEAPLQVVEMDADGKETPIPNHPATELLKRPNPFYSGATLWKCFALAWIPDGNPYFLKVRNGFGQVIQLWWIPSSMIWPRWNDNGASFIDYYEYYVNGRSYQIAVDDVLHFRDGADPDNMGRTGLSPVASVLREVCADNEVAQFNYLLMKNGGVPPVVLALKDGQGAIDFDPQKIKDTYIRSTQGDNRGKVFVSGNAVELTKVGYSPKEMDVEVLRHLPESRFASVIGIAKETLGFGAATESSTYNNVEAADRRSLMTYVKPLWGYIEDELTHQLGPDFGLQANQRFDFDLSEISALQEDQTALYQREALAYEKGVTTRAEARTALGKPVTPEDEVYFVEPMPATAQPLLNPGEQPAQENPAQINRPRRLTA